MTDSLEAQEGTIVAILPRSMYRVRLADGELVTAHVAGNLRNLMTRVLEGDRVQLELSRYHPGRGRIVDHWPASPR